ncbi:MAG TPA: hypothetical protein VF763_04190 [Candidatus Limnocylindrales bacterium]
MAEARTGSGTGGRNGRSASDDDRTTAGDMAEEMAGAAGGVSGTAKAAMGTAREAAQNVASQLPAATDTARAAMDEASRRMEASSDEMLTVGAALAFGVTIGLFISGTNRLAVALALVPAVAMGATLMDRRSRA